MFRASLAVRPVEVEEPVTVGGMKTSATVQANRPVLHVMGKGKDEDECICFFAAAIISANRV